MTKHSSVAIVVYDKKVLLLLRDDIPSLSNPNSWQLIGGEVEPGESHMDALKREMKEEIRVVAKDTTYLGRIKIADVIAAIYFVQLRKSEAGKVSLGNEGQELRFFAHDEIKKIKLTKNLRKYLDLYGQYLFEAIERGETPDPRKLGFE